MPLRRQVPNRTVNSRWEKTLAPAKDTHMPNRYKSARNAAFKAQGGRCCYCHLPMWQSSPAELACLGLRPRSASPLRCTAEHLVARQDGGKNARSNLAAACLFCNRGRHRRKQPLSPDAYRNLVQQRMAKGKWHLPGLTSILGVAARPGKH